MHGSGFFPNVNVKVYFYCMLRQTEMKNTFRYFQNITYDRHPATGLLPVLRQAG